jgi:hypothetical protein
MSKIGLSIAGIGLDIHSDNEDFLSDIADRYEGFVAPADGPDAFHVAVDTDHDITTVGEDLPRITTTGPDAFRFERRDFHMSVDKAARTLTGACAPNMYSFDSCLRVFISTYVLDLDGLMIHGASAAENGKAQLFFGVSGAGKTTTARLSAPRPVLSDELTIVKRVGDGYKAYGTPFWGELQKNGENMEADLAGLNLLVKDQEVFLEPISRKAAMAALLPCVLFFAHEPDLVKRAVNRVTDLVLTVPARKMHFLPDNSFWRLFQDVC